MSVAIAAASGNGLTATTNLSNSQAFTKMIWAKLAASPTAFSDLVGSQNAGGTSFASLTPAQFNSGKLSVQTGNGAGSDGFATQPTWTNWVCYAITGTTAGAGSLIGYWQDNAGGGFVSKSLTGVNFTVSSDNIGKNAMSQITTVAFYKEWNVVLTPAQLQTEFLSATAVLSSGLRRYLALTNAATAGTDTSGNGFNMTVTGLSDGVGSPTFPAASLPNTNVTDDVPRAARRIQHVFDQAAPPLAVLVAVSPLPPPLEVDPYQPRAGAWPRDLLSFTLNQPVLFGLDQILTPVEWDYGWDAPQLPLALRSDSYSLSALELNALNAFPIAQYDWPVPVGPRQWNRGYEFSLNLNTLGRDQVLLTGPNNLQWDPPPGTRSSYVNREYENSGLAIFLTVNTPPPVGADLPVPRRAQRLVDDFIAGTPGRILAVLSALPPPNPSIDLPPRAARRLVDYGITVSFVPALIGKEIMPQAGRWSDERRRVIIPSGALYGIEYSIPASLIPPPPPPPPPPPGIIPNVVGLSEQDAIVLITAAGFQYTPLFAPNSTFALGMVDAQNPGPGSFPAGANVIIFVSTGVLTSTGYGGSKWGPGGGGNVPVGSPPSIMVTMSEAQRKANYQINPTNTVESAMSKDTLSGQTPDDTLPKGGNNSG